MNYYIGVLKKYAVFGGRAHRREYWTFAFINFVIFMVLYIGMNLFDNVAAAITGVLIIYGLGVFIPSLAVYVRRLHDTNRSGWWLLISFVPLIGSIVLLIFILMDSNPGHNQYGPNPKGVEKVPSPEITQNNPTQ